MLKIRIKVKVYLKNLTEKTTEIFDTQAIKNKDVISYIQDNIKNKITVENNKIKLQRESDEFLHEIVFEKNQEKESEYYLKEYNSSIYFNIITTNVIISKNKIDITYKIQENENIYNYVLEMSDNL